MNSCNLEDPNITFYNAHGYLPGEAYFPSGVEQCKICEKYHESEDVYKGYCRNCIEDEFDVNKAVEYLEQYGLEKEFYIDVLSDKDIWHIKAYFVTARLVSVLKDEFIHRVNDNSFAGDQKRLLEILYGYCLNDWMHWADFVLAQEESTKRQSQVSKMQTVAS